jgi:hypothetical protein
MTTPVGRMTSAVGSGTIRTEAKVAVGEAEVVVWRLREASLRRQE